MTILMILATLFIFYAVGMAAWNLNLAKTWEVATLSCLGPIIVLSVVWAMMLPGSSARHALGIGVLVLVALAVVGLTLRLFHRSGGGASGRASARRA